MNWFEITYRNPSARLQYTVIAMLLCLCCIVSCGNEITRLTVEVVSHPQGGFNVEELRCRIRGRLEGGSEHIETIIEWWWSDTLGQDEQALKQESHTFLTGDWEHYTTILEAPTYFYLFQHFWVKVKWEDEDGTEHAIESDTAYCKILSTGHVFPDMYACKMSQEE